MKFMIIGWYWKRKTHIYT